jgi:multidrug transporter EmrE-like cation transporter
VTTALYVVAYAVLSTAGVLLLRSSLEGSGVSSAAIRTLLTEPRFLLGFAFYALSFLTWLLALRRYEVSAIFPVFVGAGYCAVVAGSAIFLGEELTLSRVAGIAVILAGILLVLR